MILVLYDHALHLSLDKVPVHPLFLFPRLKNYPGKVSNSSETDNSDHSQNIVLPSGLLLDISIHTTQKLEEYFDHLICLFLAWCLKIDDMHFHHRTVKQRTNDLCQFLLVANAVNMFIVANVIFKFP